MTLPQVLGIGFPKAATTFLSDILSRHPEVCFSSKKETHFFELNETRDMDRPNAESIYSGFFANHDPTRHKFAMEWTVTYITDDTVLDRIRAFYPEDPVFLLASRDPVRSFLSSYFYHRTISNDLHAARMSQAECLRTRPDVYVAPYMLATCYRRLRERFPTARVIVVPHGAIKRDADGTVGALYQALGLSPSDHSRDMPPSNVPYPYRSWQLDKIIRWTLVKIYGNRRTKSLYSRSDNEKPRLMRFLHGLNRGTYGFEPGVEEEVRERLLPDFADFVSLVTNDENTLVLGSRDDITEGLV
ncbi:sulfotransferase [Rhodospirillaceae bacterium KN72]|uniref:Sulfotransferase n=1 Tax=Pacificispira spongiicola TaxID=2729598 RepID=A0A7Y0E1L4_9PROT|nr:sulfotransferase [Pacificispira spongiicola]NMM45572.1 sulfotransferase [Pacificispira spongiicola]